MKSTPLQALIHAYKREALGRLLASEPTRQQALQMPTFGPELLQERREAFAVQPPLPSLTPHHSSGPAPHLSETQGTEREGGRTLRIELCNPGHLGLQRG